MFVSCLSLVCLLFVSCLSLACLIVVSFFLPLSRTRERFKDEEEKQQESFNIKVPDPLSSGEPPGSFTSNEFLCLTWFSSAVSYEAAEKIQR